MAYLESKLVTTLTGAAAIAALVGTRVFPIFIPQDEDFPAITYERTSGEKEYTTEGYEGLERATITISAWAADYGTVKNLGQLIHAALLADANFQTFMLNDQDGYNDESSVFRYTAVYRITHREF